MSDESKRDEKQDENIDTTIPDADAFRVGVLQVRTEIDKENGDWAVMYLSPDERLSGEERLELGRFRIAVLEGASETHLPHSREMFLMIGKRWLSERVREHFGHSCEFVEVPVPTAESSEA